MKLFIQALKEYCESCWMPAAAHFGSLVGIFTLLHVFRTMFPYYPWPPEPPIQYIIYSIFYGTYVMMLSPVIINLYKRQWGMVVVSWLLCIMFGTPFALILLISGGSCRFD
jgi:hypothetical protein